jgi:diguanylate cyclase (GGDEF)-like protein/PAS domain S-box-containing protein
VPDWHATAQAGRGGLIGPAALVQPRAATLSRPAWRSRRGVALDRTLLALAATGWAIAIAWLTFGLGDPGEQRAVADVGETALDVLAAGLVLRAALYTEIPRIRLGWAVLGVATLVYAAGDGAWAWLDLGGGSTASPSLADVAYVAYYPIVVAALFMFQRASSLRRDTLRLTIDSLIVVIGGGIVVWHTLFRPVLEALDPNPLSAALALGYPIGDLVLLFGVAATALRHPPEIDASALTALVGGLALMFVADVGYGQLNLAGAFDLVRWPDVIYLSSTLLIALAGYFAAHPAAAMEGRGKAMSRWLLGLPYVALAAGYWVLIALAVGRVTGELTEVLYGVVLLTAMVLIRQELVLRENSRLLAEQARQESEARFRALAADSSDAIVLVDRDGNVTDATPVVGRVLGVDSSKLVGRPISRLVHADDAERIEALIADVAAGRSVSQPVEWRLWDATGVWRQVETIAANRLDDPAVGQIVLTTRDVQERKTLERQLTQVAMHDLLTDLPNRSLFHDRVGQALASAAGAQRQTSVLWLGLDGFKRVNESLGHAVGDQVLGEVARRLGASVGSADTCARLGGDEFGVLLDGHSTRADTLAAANRILTALRVPIEFADSPIHLTASLGTSTAAPTEVDAGNLLRRAEVAKSVARKSGGDRVALFEPAMQEAVQVRFELEAELRRAIDQAEFVLDYQPIVDLATGELVGAEALIRWDHPTQGRIAPSVFIPLAEETGLIDEIGEWVLRTACTEVARWAQLSPGRVPRVSINVSAHQLADPRLAWTVQAAMARAGAAPSWVTLELTESMLMQHSSASIDRLHAIRALGVQIAIDDFGTGYSSLAYLERFPVSHIKIDRSFVTPLDDPRRGAGVVRAIVEIARALGLQTVAEGIETPTQLRRLQELGGVLGQGYLFSRPLGRDAMADLVALRTGPAFAAEVGTAGQKPSLRVKAPDPARVESEDQPIPLATSKMSYRGLRSVRLKESRRASFASAERIGPKAVSRDGVSPLVPPPAQVPIAPPGSGFRH